MRYSNCCSFKLTWRLMPSLIPPRSSRNISVRLKCVAQHARTISNIAEMGCKEQLSRRSTLVALVSLSGCTALARPGQGLSAPIPVDVPPASVRPELTPDMSLFDPTDTRLREALNAVQEGLNAPELKAEEATWTRIIEKYGPLDAPWVPDVVGRAYGNRGNARLRLGRLQDALLDYNKSIEICPYSADPILNRGVALEALGRFQEAASDYRAVLAADPNDPAAWNNLGNATAGLGKWSEAADYFRKATIISPEFSFAAANLALAQYEVGQRNEAIRSMRSILRKYPEFPDMRAALAAALWAEGLEDQAESSWSRVDDVRYKDRRWLRVDRRWPPQLAAALEALLDVKSIPRALS